MQRLRKHGRLGNFSLIKKWLIKHHTEWCCIKGTRKAQLRNLQQASEKPSMVEIEAKCPQPSSWALPMRIVTRGPVGAGCTGGNWIEASWNSPRALTFGHSWNTVDWIQETRASLHPLFPSSLAIPQIINSSICHLAKALSFPQLRKGHSAPSAQKVKNFLDFSTSLFHQYVGKRKKGADGKFETVPVTAAMKA